LDPSPIRDFPGERLSALLNRAVRNAPRAAPWAVGAVVVAQLVSFGSWWLSHTRREPSAPTPKTQPPPPPEALAAQIIAARLFGSAPGAGPGTGDGADDPAQHYALKGIVYLGTSGDGFAILATREGKSKTFRTGESLESGLQLHEVSSNYVLLERDSQLTRLTLPRGALALALVPGAAGGGPEPATARLSDDTRTTLEAFGLNVIHDGSGAISGISGRGSESWHRSGLLPTDVIVAIDGTPVGDLLQQPYAIDRASVAAVTVLTVLRDGVSTTIEAEPARTISPVRRRVRS
jgi:hypothetical protein